MQREMINYVQEKDGNWKSVSIEAIRVVNGRDVIRTLLLGVLVHEALRPRGPDSLCPEVQRFERQFKAAIYIYIYIFLMKARLIEVAY
jgi:hypothetical protein